MRYFPFALLALCSFSLLSAQQIQTPAVVTDVEIISDDKLQDADHIWKKVDVLPEYPGGINALMTFLSYYIEYPKECAEAKIQGKVVVGFAVMKDGSIGNIEVKRSVHPLLDAEAVRVVKLMPKWKPGKKDGKTVNTWFSLPVNFRIPSSE
ncbi:MAG: energy transducer TonB [Clostridium sp.]|nr:energy transducer TonB [Prevotella sp.]MCM1429242.1 energy transducer TonB [Clostridium sp.]